ncbi:Cytochrome bd-I ubiquinol oxidase subunit 2 [Planctomycetes bacterium Poly30]|uniref:Cytochrome bd-I ubiquinol oxidase subunit 2 n=1 Tax=Saltatorellus ferox TaxID=2528018 RepID=A0A518EMB5_9BACT|nr:Cytochrome bd-I ubiquinol oxidase subunit 2 [Planctomycetes bacterium Poly30]
MSSLSLAMLADAADSVGWTGLSHDTLGIVWFGVLGVLLIGYAILDGFDLGVGMMQPFVARTDEERRLVLNSIGPIWDGNEVWLVTFGGALFAAFPEAYATIFSAFYDALFLVLFGLVLRAVSIEFRSKLETARWRSVWDHVFFGSSVLVTFLFGVAVGNAMRGIALDERHEYTGGFLDLLSPFAIAAGLMAVALFALHGSIFLMLKTHGDLQQRVLPRVRIAYINFIVTFLVTTGLALWKTPTTLENMATHPILWTVPATLGVAVIGVKVAHNAKKNVAAFALSSLMIASFVALLGVGLFPHLVRSSVIPESHSLTVFNASSSTKTLEIMLLIAAIGMPLVLTYTGIVYWTFRGKVRLDAHSY